jgi:tetratricopeptide (TPR) repeat protein
MVEYVINGETAWAKQVLEKELEYLVTEGVISNESGIIRFNGDDFDKIYTKYFAREKGVNLSFPDLPLEVLLDVRMRGRMKRIKGIEQLNRLFINLNRDLSLIFEDLMNDVKRDGDIAEPHGSILEILFPIILSYKDMKSIPFLFLKITLPMLSQQTCYYAGKPTETEQIEIGLEVIRKWKENMKDVGGDLVVIMKEIPTIPLEIVFDKIMNSSNDRLKNSVTSLVELEMVYDYLGKPTTEGAYSYGNLLYKHSNGLTPEGCNNVGYLFMNSGQFYEAEELFNKAIAGYTIPSSSALPNYNLGILNAKKDEYGQALNKIDLCIKLLESPDSGKQDCACLVAPKVIDGQLLFEEDKERPDLLVVARKARETIALHLQSSAKV